MVHIGQMSNDECFHPSNVQISQIYILIMFDDLKRYHVYVFQQPNSVTFAEKSKSIFAVFCVNSRYLQLIQYVCFLLGCLKQLTILILNSFIKNLING